MPCRSHAAAAGTSVPGETERKDRQDRSGSGRQAARVGYVEREGSKTIPMGVDNEESFQMKARNET